MSYEGTFNRLLAFSTCPTLSTETVVELEREAEKAAVTQGVLSDICMSQCTELLEVLPLKAAATRALLHFLSNICLRDENRVTAVRFGVPNTCVLLLQQWSELDDDTLYYIFDLITTLASASGEGRRTLRPAIPRIIACMNERKTSGIILFAGCCSLSTLAMLDAENGELIATRGGLQTFVNAFRFAHEEDRKLKCIKKKTEKQREQQELISCVITWSRDAALKVCHTASCAIDEHLSKIDFGVYGHSIELDQFLWDLRFERRKFKARQPEVERK